MALSPRHGPKTRFLTGLSLLHTHDRAIINNLHRTRRAHIPPAIPALNLPAASEIVITTKKNVSIELHTFLPCTTPKLKAQQLSRKRTLTPILTNHTEWTKFTGCVTTRLIWGKVGKEPAAPTT